MVIPNGGGKRKGRPKPKPRPEEEEIRPPRPEPPIGQIEKPQQPVETKPEKSERPRPNGRPPGLAAPVQPKMVLPQLPQQVRPTYTPPYGRRPSPTVAGEGLERTLAAAYTPRPVAAAEQPAPTTLPTAEQPQATYPLTAGDWEQLVGMPSWRRQWEIASRTQRGIPLQGYEIHSVSREGYPGSSWTGEWGPESESAWLTQAERGGGGGGYVAPEATTYPAVVLPSLPEATTPTAMETAPIAMATVPKAGFAATAGAGLAAPALPNWYVQQPTFSGDIGSTEKDILWAANSLLPFMNPQDQAEIARYLYVAVGGSAGPFAPYLGANESPFGGTNALNTQGGYDALRTNLSNMKDNNLRAAALQMLDLAQGTLPAPGQARTRAQEITLQDGLRRMVQAGPEGWDILGTILTKVFKPTEARPEAGEMVWSEDLNQYVPYYNVQWL